MPEISLLRHDEPLDYREGVELQHRIAAEVRAGRSPGAVVLCEHPSVYTAGRRTEQSDLPTDGSPVVETDRGGRITWHGPGQLVAYPVIRLPEPLDVVAWVRDLEQVLIDTAASVGVVARRIEGRSGAWVGSGSTAEKVAAIGLHVADRVTTHGIAMNCSNALEAYGAIVPCGIADAGVTTLSRVLGHRVDPVDVRETMATLLLEAVSCLQSGTHLADVRRQIDVSAPAAAPTATAVAA